MSVKNRLLQLSARGLAGLFPPTLWALILWPCQQITENSHAKVSTFVWFLAIPFRWEDGVCLVFILCGDWITYSLAVYGRGRMIINSRSSCLCISRDRITGMCHHDHSLWTTQEFHTCLQCILIKSTPPVSLPSPYYFSFPRWCALFLNLVALGCKTIYWSTYDSRGLHP